MIRVYEQRDFLDVLPDDEFLEQYLPHLVTPISGGAVTVTPQNNPVAARLVVNTDVDETSDDNMTGTTGSIYVVDVDNTANAAASFVKIYDAASPTVGTTAPDWVFKVPASVRRIFACTDGVAFATALSIACVTTGGTAGTTGPTSAVTVRILCS